MTIRKRYISPRQKMINLMYVVLMAMLALNVSSDVLDGFTVMESSLNNTMEQTNKENQALYDALQEQKEVNSIKVQEWQEKADRVKEMAERICKLLEEVKIQIAREADGKNASVNELQNKERLDAAAQVLLSPNNTFGDELVSSIDSYRKEVVSLVSDPAKGMAISASLSTAAPANKDNKNWLEYHFESVPAVAAIAYLTKVQTDIRYTEGEVLHDLLNSVDAKDIRVNALNALVVPCSTTVVKGNIFKANIVMAAVDTTQRPDIYINDKAVELKDGVYETVCPQTGSFTLRGFLQVQGKNGGKIRRDFEQKYTVVEPTATVSSDLMNVLYAGYSNPISVSVPGVPSSQVTASMEGGTLVSDGEGKYIARPNSTVKSATIRVFSSVTGKQQQMGQYTFRVRRMPDPASYILIKNEEGFTERFAGGEIARNALLAAGGIGAAMDDGIIDVPFQVAGFETVFFDRMGNAVAMTSEGSRFSAKQKEAFQKPARNRRFYISHVSAIGPDGVSRKIKTSMEIIIK